MMKMKMRHTHTCHSQARVRANRDKRATWMETSLRSSVLSFESCCCHQVFRRHNAAVQLETDRWPALKKRRIGKPTSDEQYTQALCEWVAALEALLRHLQGRDNRMIADHLADGYRMSSNLGSRRGHCDDGWMTTRRKGHEPRDACDVLIPILRGKCGRVVAAHPSTEAAQHGMTRRFGTRWIRRLMQDGRGALHRHDLDGRDHDRHHPGPAHRGRHHETSGTGPYSTSRSSSRPCNSLPSPCAGTMRCLTCASLPRSVSWVLHACAEVEKHEHHNESLAPRAPQWHPLR